MREDPRVGCLLAFALPFLSLSFGQAPSQAAMDAAGRLLEPHLPHLHPWEVRVVAGRVRVQGPHQRLLTVQCLLLAHAPALPLVAPGPRLQRHMPAWRWWRQLQPPWQQSPLRQTCCSP